MYRNRWQGMSEVQRGSLIRWLGNTPFLPMSTFSDIWNPPYKKFTAAIQARGFTVTDIVEEQASDGASNWWFVEAIVPAAGSLEGAASFITQAAWEVFGHVEQVSVNEVLQELPPAPPATPARVRLPNETPNNQANNQANNQINNNPKLPGKCDSKEGLEWFSCQLGFDSTAQQLGLGIGSGVTLSLAAILLIGIVILKK